MSFIDLSSELYTGFPVYPWDPEVLIEQIFTLENDGWNMNRIEINSHDGTHVNVPIHGKKHGKTLSDYTLQDFIWPARLYESESDIVSGEWLIFHKSNISQALAEKIVHIRPLFVALSWKFEFDLDVEKYLFEHDIISFERLENTEKLPKRCMFYAVPLKIRNGDGSPVRAFAVPLP